MKMRMKTEVTIMVLWWTMNGNGWWLFDIMVLFNDCENENEIENENENQSRWCSWSGTCTWRTCMLRLQFSSWLSSWDSSWTLAKFLQCSSSVELVGRLYSAHDFDHLQLHHHEPYEKIDFTASTSLFTCSFTAKSCTRGTTLVCPRLWPSVASPPRAVREERLQWVHDFDRLLLHHQEPCEKKDCSVSTPLIVGCFTAKSRTRGRTSPLQWVHDFDRRLLHRQVPYEKKDCSESTTLTVCCFTVKSRTRGRTAVCPRLCQSAPSPPSAVREEGLQWVLEFDRPQLHRHEPCERITAVVVVPLLLLFLCCCCSFVVVPLLLYLCCCCSFVVVLLLLLLLSSANNLFIFFSFSLSLSVISTPFSISFSGIKWIWWQKSESEKENDDSIKKWSWKFFLHAP